MEVLGELSDSVMKSIISSLASALKVNKRIMGKFKVEKIICALLVITVFNAENHCIRNF